MNVDVIIAGGGFHGIYAAWRWAKVGQKVLLLEAGDVLGGLMQSREWQGYWLDNGMHNLDMRTSLCSDFYSDILRDHIIFLEPNNWASTIDETYTYGFEMPDLSIDAVDVAGACLNELNNISLKCHKTADDFPPDALYTDWYRETYGHSLSEATLPWVGKVTGGQTDAIAFVGKSALNMFSRPKLGTDEEMLSLKRSSAFWNDRVGVSNLCQDTQFCGTDTVKVAYPLSRGLTGFCELVEQRLREIGVVIKYGESVTGMVSTDKQVSIQCGSATYNADHLFWSLPDYMLGSLLDIETDLKSHLLPVGCCLYAYEVPVESVRGPDYLTDYSLERRVIRYSKPGIFSRQISKDGYTVVLGEIPAHPKDQPPMLETGFVHRCFDDFRRSGYLSMDSEFRNCTAWSIPVGFSLPSNTWHLVNEQLQSTLSKNHPRIMNVANHARGRTAFIHHFESELRGCLS